MAKDYRVCAGVNNFNTGASKCPLDPDKIKGVILVHRGNKLPATMTVENLMAACHAEKPNRIYAIKPIVEYSVSGGEAQTSANGYGASKITGYSARIDTFQLQDVDMALRANLVSAKNVPFDMYPYDANNVIYGMNDGTNQLHGIELTGVYPSGQEWDSSSADASLSINAMLKDVEKYMKNASVMQVDFDIEQAVTGLTYVEFLSQGENKYKLVEHFGKLDVTPYFGAKIAENASSVLNGASSATYNPADATLTITGIPTLKDAATLYAAGIEGIEQWV